jgi:hypothetical protein
MISGASSFCKTPSSAKKAPYKAIATGAYPDHQGSVAVPEKVSTTSYIPGSNFAIASAC